VEVLRVTPVLASEENRQAKARLVVVTMQSVSETHHLGAAMTILLLRLPRSMLREVVAVVADVQVACHGQEKRHHLG
jgi:hypothetical protein